APGVVVPTGTALGRVAEDQASAEGERCSVRHGFLLDMGRFGALLKIHLCTVYCWVKRFRIWFGSAPRSQYEKTPRKLTLNACPPKKGPEVTHRKTNPRFRR